MTPLLLFFRNAWLVTLRNLVVWKHGFWSSAVGYVGEPLLNLVALGYGLGRVVPELDGMSYPEFIAPGLIVSTVMYTATFECTFGSYTRLETQRTFDAILATPIALEELLFGEVLFGAIKSAIGGVVVLLVATLFGLVPSWWSLGVLPVALLAGVLFSSLAFIATAMSRSYDVFNYYFTLVVAPMYLFGGVFFPLGRMPAWVQRASFALPLTHVVELSRSLVRGAPTAMMAVHVVAIVLFTLPAYAVTLRLLRRRVIR